MTNQLQDKILRLELYLSKNKDRLDGPIPTKHLTRAEQFKSFIRKEIRDTKAKVSELKLGDK